jgi:hypothetical protein
MPSVKLGSSSYEHPDAVRQILLKRHGCRYRGDFAGTDHAARYAGVLITVSYRNGVPDEEIMGHTRHRSLPTMRGCIRCGKLGKAGPAGEPGL